MRKSSFYIFFLIFIWNIELLSQSIVHAEYFIDADPGYGSGIPVIITEGDTVMSQLTISMKNLAPGFHHLYIRAQDSIGQWSIINKDPFLVLDTLTQVVSNPIQKVEYFIDADPGYGSGILVIITEGDTVMSQLAISMKNLAPGFHHLYIRAQDSIGQWSIINKDPFLVLDTLTQVVSNPIQKAEYFIDADPGYGSGIPVIITEGDTVMSQLAISMKNLAPGFHHLYIRAQDSIGQWSIIYKILFFIDEDTLDQAPNVLGVELWSQNPQKEIFQFLSSGPSLQGLVSIDISTLDTGNYSFYLRPFDEKGVRGFYVPLDSFLVLECGIVYTTQDSIKGSLRNNIDCIVNGGTITFDSSVYNQVIELQMPEIVINKNLFFVAQEGSNITISNKDPYNTEALLSASGVIKFDGLIFNGKTDQSFILLLKMPDGNFYFTNSIISNTEIRIE